MGSKKSISQLQQPLIEWKKSLIRSRQRVIELKKYLIRSKKYLIQLRQSHFRSKQRRSVPFLGQIETRQPQRNCGKRILSLIRQTPVAAKSSIARLSLARNDAVQPRIDTN